MLKLWNDCAKGAKQMLISRLDGCVVSRICNKQCHFDKILFCSRLMMFRSTFCIIVVECYYHWSVFFYVLSSFCFIASVLLLILSYLILSYLILSYLILSYLILSYLILSYYLHTYIESNNCFDESSRERTWKSSRAAHSSECRTKSTEQCTFNSQFLISNFWLYFISLLIVISQLFSCYCLLFCVIYVFCHSNLLRVFNLYSIMILLLIVNLIPSG